MDVCQQAELHISRWEIARHLGAQLRKMWRRLLDCWEVHRERQALLTLDERILRDMGVSRVDAVREASRSFWDIGGTLGPER